MITASQALEISAASVYETARINEELQSIELLIKEAAHRGETRIVLNRGIWAADENYNSDPNRPESRLVDRVIKRLVECQFTVNTKPRSYLNSTCTISWGRRK